MECLVPRFQSGRQSLMVWEAVWHYGRSELVRFDQSDSAGRRGGVTAAIYRDQITKGVLKRCWNQGSAWWRGYGRPRILEDNARIHTSKANRDTGHKQHFVYLDHPPSLPDLNPIEHCWAMVKKQLAELELPERPTTLDTLFEAAQEAWKEIPQGYIDNMIDSMPGRLEHVWRAKGGHIKG